MRVGRVAAATRPPGRGKLYGPRPGHGGEMTEARRRGPAGFTVRSGGGAGGSKLQATARRAAPG
jgi:hypothetical protein